MIHGLGRRRCWHTPKDIRHICKLLVRVTLLVEEVLIALAKLLLFQRLNLSTGLLLCLVDTHELLVVLLAKLTQLPRRCELLLQTLKTEVGTELPRLFPSLNARQPILSGELSVLLGKLIGSLRLTQCLLLCLELRGLVELLRLHPGLSAKLLDAKSSRKILSADGKPCLLVSELCLQLPCGVGLIGLLGLLICRLKTLRLDVTKLYA